MARATFVKKARKDVPGTNIKKGDSYYWWAFMVGGRGGPKHYSKTRPKASQLTSSEFLSGLYAVQEGLEINFNSIEEATAALEDAKGNVEDLGSDCEEKLNSMPDGLQQGPTGELLQQRVDGCQELVGSIENAITDIEGIEPNEEEELSEQIAAVIADIDFGSIE